MTMMSNWLCQVRRFTLLLLVISISGCDRPRNPEKGGSGGAATADSGTVFPIGVILPSSGRLAELGFYERHAMELYPELGQRPGSIRLVFADSRSTAAGAVAAANQLIAVNRVRAIVASTTGAALAVQPVARAAGIPLIAFCMDPTIAGTDSSTVRFYIGVEEEARQINNFLISLPRTERVGILYAAVPVWRKVVNDTYVPQLTQHFATKPVVEEYSLEDRDFRAVLGRLAGAGVSTLVILGYGFEYPPIFNQLAQLGFRSQMRRIVGGWGFLYTPLPAADLEGVVVAGPSYVFSRNAEADAFAARFEQRTGRKANFDAAFAYELARTLPTLRAAGALTDSTIKKGVVALGNREGVVGQYQFSPSGNMIVGTGLGVYRGGVLVPFEH